MVFFLDIWSFIMVYFSILYLRVFEKFVWNITGIYCLFIFVGYY